MNYQIRVVSRQIVKYLGKLR